MPLNDAIQIGNCWLLRGDSIKIMPRLGTVDHIVTDPPYEEMMHSSKQPATQRLRTDGRRDLRPLDFQSIDKIRGDVVGLASSLCRGWFIAFCTPEGVGRWADEINASPMKYKRACAWVKPDSTPQLNGQGPAMGYECFIAAWAGRGKSRWNAGGKRGVYKHLTNPQDRHGGHPTEKPWRLMREIVHDFTSPGDLILDPFMGSGTTLVAAALTGRPAIGIEKSPEYFEMAVARLKKAAASARSIGAQLDPEIQGELSIC